MKRVDPWNKLDDPNTSWEELVPLLDELDEMEGAVPFDTQAGWDDLMTRIPKKRRFFGKLPLAAAIALVCLVTTVTAGSFGLHEKLAYFLGAGEEQTALLTQGISQPKAVMLPGAMDGVKIEIIQVVADHAGIYALYEATIPKRVDLPEELTWEECFLRPSTQGNTGWGFGSDILEIEGNRITGVAYSHALDAPIVPGKVTADFENLGYWEDNAFVTVLEGEWHLFWNQTEMVESTVLTPDQEVLVGDKKTTVTYIGLSPISVTVEITGTEMKDLPVSLTFWDGTILPLSMRDAHCYSWHTDYLADMSRLFYLLPEPIDVTAVTSVVVGSPIPLP
ncbi:MAG: hypothetical protein IKU62_01680 [Ruminiclostridium sp.]|nr:hypothetical protein [Ruminiclostridium sp.]